MAKGARFFIAGGAGFVGSHFTDHLLAGGASGVTLYDNFTSGQEWHFRQHRGDARLSVVRGEVGALDALVAAMRGHDAVIHLASNPDIARAATEPDVDFWQGTVLTNNVVEGMRRAGVPRLIYASGSGVYGDLGAREVHEDHGPLLPISTYGASKLAGEALISAYCHMFGLRAVAFRFANVVGPRQTHGVGFDFIRRLRADPSKLRILGDGTQSKSYIHVDDIIRAVMLAHRELRGPYQVFNVGTGDAITVNEIADLACEVLGLDPAKVAREHTGGDRGWKGDVPVVRLSTERIRALGWKCERSSRAALEASMRAMLVQLQEEEGK